ncbi:hypothetical protein [Peribacillus sp. SCS-37]|uniref:hypothetical protein n=1 Tax=Paraperibacillus esterisolvens TaxID=3115296 RepID=UPI003906A07E
MSLEKEYYQGQNFWKKSPSGKRIDYELNDTVVAQAEALLSVKFPPSLIRLLKIPKWGRAGISIFSSSGDG